jgi:hypothetical protein
VTERAPDPLHQSADVLQRPPSHGKSTHSGELSKNVNPEPRNTRKTRKDSGAGDWFLCARFTHSAATAVVGQVSNMPVLFCFHFPHLERDRILISSKQTVPICAPREDFSTRQLDQSSFFVCFVYFVVNLNRASPEEITTPRHVTTGHEIHERWTREIVYNAVALDLFGSSRRPL